LLRGEAGAPVSSPALIWLGPGEAGAPASDSSLIRLVCRGCGTGWGCREDGDLVREKRRAIWYCPWCGDLLPFAVVVWLGGAQWIEDEMSSYSVEGSLFYAASNAGHWHLRDRGITWHLRDEVERVPTFAPRDSRWGCCSERTAP
jgi:hypothetical protein